MRDTIDMAFEAKLVCAADDPTAFWPEVHDMTNELKAFEALVRADEREQGQKWFDAVTAQHKQEILAEREACAKVADYYASGMDRNYSEIIADDIRNRGST